MPTLTQEARHQEHTFLTKNQKKLLFLLLKCIIMAIVVALFLFFIGFATIIILHFLMMTNAFRRRCIRLNQVLFADTIPTTSAASRKTSSFLELPDLLPKVEYSALAFPRSMDCAICLESFDEGDDCKSLPTCQHLFHSNCVDQWLGRKPSCPTCRSRVDLSRVKRGSRITAADRWKMLWEDDFEEDNFY